MVALAFVPGFIVAAVVMLWPRASTPFERSDLEADAAFALHMPGADELSRVGGDRLFTLEGEQVPFAGHIYGTTATGTDVYTFYESELARLGWRKQALPYPRSSAELENRLYCKAGTEFRLAIKNKETAFRSEFYRGRVYTAVFDARLIAVDPSSPCPLPPLTPRPTRS
jgi:hypothetical protein